MGGAHALLLLFGLVKNAALAAVCDVSEDARARFLKRGGKRAKKIPVFSDYKEMANGAKFDAVIVAVPHYSHVEIAKFFIGRGKHTLIEKPVAVTERAAADFNAFLDEPSKLDIEKTVVLTERGAADFDAFLDARGEPPVEKSIAETATDFGERGKSPIEKTAEETGRGTARFNAFSAARGGAAAVMYNQRTNPVYKKAKALIDAGALGEIRRADFIVTDWYRSDAYYKNNSWRASWSGEGGGILINQCVHQLDILQWLIGLPESVYAKMFTKGRDITAENEVAALLRYKNDAVCVLRASGRELNGANRIEIAGDRGRLVMGKYSMKYISWEPSEPEVNTRTVKGYGGAPKRVRRYFYGPRVVPDLILGQQRRVVANFAAHILNGTDLIAPAKEGIRALSLINGIYLSAWEGREVAFPIDALRYERMLNEKAGNEKKVL